MNDATGRLEDHLKRTRVSDTERFLRENAALFIDPASGFPAYMRLLLKQKGLRQQDVFLRADISEGYGYKLISGEKRTRRRDTLLRLFFAAGFTLDEAQKALRLSELPALYPRFKRDAVLMIALNSRLCDPAAVDELLTLHGLAPLLLTNPAEGGSAG